MKKETKTKKKYIKKRKTTKDKIGKQKTSKPKNELGFSKDNIVWIEKATKKLKFKEFQVRKNKEMTRRCLYNMGTEEKPQQCKKFVYKGSIFCNSHGGQRKFSAPLRLQELGIFHTSGALEKEIEEVKPVDKKQLESLEDDIKLQMAAMRNFLKNSTNKDLIKKANTFRLMCETLVNSKMNWHEMQYGKKVSFSIETVNYVLYKVFNIIVANISDVEEIKKIKVEIQKLGLEIKETELG